MDDPKVRSALDLTPSAWYLGNGLLGVVTFTDVHSIQHGFVVKDHGRLAMRWTQQGKALGGLFGLFNHYDLLRRAG